MRIKCLQLSMELPQLMMWVTEEQKLLWSDDDVYSLFQGLNNLEDHDK